uniref:Protein kinase domain-containing protein n=1 Tax=Meloidogyne hapla TaxID=6305 RepID=A0A1I8BSR7_MELHA
MEQLKNFDMIDLCNKLRLRHNDFDAWLEEPGLLGKRTCKAFNGSLAGNCWGVESSRGSNTTRSELNNSQLGSDRGSAVGSGNAASDVGSERDVVSPHYETSASHGHTEKCPCREFNIEDFDKNETIIKNEHQKIELRVRKGEDNEIGKGGFGKIYHAIRGNGCVALKVYDLVDEEVRRQAVNEIEILKELKGKNGIIKYYGSEINKEHRKAFIVMELGAMNLHKYIKEIKNNGIEGDELDKETLKVVIEAARALEKFHNCKKVNSRWNDPSRVVVSWEILGYRIRHPIQKSDIRPFSIRI